MVNLTPYHQLAPFRVWYFTNTLVPIAPDSEKVGAGPRTRPSDVLEGFLFRLAEICILGHLRSGKEKPRRIDQEGVLWCKRTRCQQVVPCVRGPPRGARCLYVWGSSRASSEVQGHPSPTFETKVRLEPYRV